LPCGLQLKKFNSTFNSPLTGVDDPTMPTNTETVIPISTRMHSLFFNLSVAERVAFYPLRAVIKDALENNDFEAVTGLIENQPVPPALASVKAQMLAMLSA
jgi:hypothetical protein